MRYKKHVVDSGYLDEIMLKRILFSLSYRISNHIRQQQQLLGSNSLSHLKMWKVKIMFQSCCYRECMKWMERIGQPTFKKLFCLSLFFLFRQIILLASWVGVIVKQSQVTSWHLDSVIHIKYKKRIEYLETITQSKVSMLCKIKFNFKIRSNLLLKFSFSVILRILTHTKNLQGNLAFR